MFPHRSRKHPIDDSFRDKGSRQLIHAQPGNKRISVKGLPTRPNESSLYRLVD